MSDTDTKDRGKGLKLPEFFTKYFDQISIDIYGADYMPKSGIQIIYQGKPVESVNVPDDVWELHSVFFANGDEVGASRDDIISKMEIQNESC